MKTALDCCIFVAAGSLLTIAAAAPIKATIANALLTYLRILYSPRIVGSYE
jgi:hypothetical protein